MYRFQASARAGRAEEAFEEHNAIVKALEKRSPDEAETGHASAYSQCLQELDARRGSAVPRARCLGQVAWGGSHLKDNGVPVTC